jgi:hypothetical protein
VFFKETKRHCGSDGYEEFAFDFSTDFIEYLFYVAGFNDYKYDVGVGG